MIETEASDLTESPSSVHNSDLILNLKRNSTNTAIDPSGEVFASMVRLQELERKKSAVRYKRFSLEQRLHNFQRVAILPTGASEQEGRYDEGHNKHQLVVNWKYATDLNQSDDTKTRVSEGASYRGNSVPQTIIYTGRLNTAGQPHDDNALLRFGDDQVYKGGVRNGERYGLGTNQWPNGQAYSGEWQNDSRNGRGTHIWKDGRTVTGTWKDGHLHGQVYFRWPNGAVFDGNTSMGKKEGKGVTTSPDGTVYNGNYANGKEDGFGTLIRPNGVKYRGQFRNGFKEGYGVMLWHTRTYDGEWLLDKPHGQGRVVWSNGAVFSGQFENGTYNGLGAYTWPSGKKFVGRWEKGAKTGHGLHTWPSGKKYDGEYAKGLKDGYGRMAWPDGSMYCGGFRRNRRCGRGIQTNADGAVVHCGLWEDDRPCEGNTDGTNKVVLVALRRGPFLRMNTADPSAPHQLLQTGAVTAGETAASNEEKEENDDIALPPTLKVDSSSVPLPATPAVVTPMEEEAASSGGMGFFPLSPRDD